jgi:hypothetical protein
MHSKRRTVVERNKFFDSAARFAELKFNPNLKN